MVTGSFFFFFTSIFNTNSPFPPFLTKASGPLFVKDCRTFSLTWGKWSDLLLLVNAMVYSCNTCQWKGIYCLGGINEKFFAFRSIFGAVCKFHLLAECSEWNLFTYIHISLYWLNNSVCLFDINFKWDWIVWCFFYSCTTFVFSAVGIDYLPAVCAEVILKFWTKASLCCCFYLCKRLVFFFKSENIIHIRRVKKTFTYLGPRGGKVKMDWLDRFISLLGLLLVSYDANALTCYWVVIHLLKQH